MPFTSQSLKTKDQQNAVLTDEKTFENIDSFTAVLLAATPVNGEIPAEFRAKLVNAAMSISIDEQGHLVVQDQVLPRGNSGPIHFITIDPTGTLGKEMDPRLVDAAAQIHVNMKTERGDTITKPAGNLMSLSLLRKDAGKDTAKYAFPGGLATTVKTLEEYQQKSPYEKSLVANVSGSGKFAEIIDPNTPEVRQRAVWINARLKLLDVLIANVCPTFYQNIKNRASGAFPEPKDHIARCLAISRCFFNLEQYLKDVAVFDEKGCEGKGFAPAATEAEAFFAELELSAAENPNEVFSVLAQLETAFLCSHHTKPAWFCWPDVQFLIKSFVPNEETLQDLENKKLIDAGLAKVWRDYIQKNGLAASSHKALRVLITTSYECSIPLVLMHKIQTMCQRNASTRSMFAREEYQVSIDPTVNLLLRAWTYEHEGQLTLPATVSLETGGAADEGNVKEFFCGVNEVRLDMIVKMQEGDRDPNNQLARAFWDDVASAIKQEAATCLRVKADQSADEIFAQLNKETDLEKSFCRRVFEEKLSAVMIDPLDFYTKLFPLNYDDEGRSPELQAVSYSMGCSQYPQRDENLNYVLTEDGQPVYKVTLKEISTANQEKIKESLKNPAMTEKLTACARAAIQAAVKDAKKGQQVAAAASGFLGAGGRRGGNGGPIGLGVPGPAGVFKP